MRLRLSFFSSYGCPITSVFVEMLLHLCQKLVECIYVDVFLSSLFSSFVSWIFTGRTDAEAKAPTLWPLDAKNWLIGKDLDAGKDWGQEEKVMTVDEMVGWHHRLGGHGSEWAQGVGDGQGGLGAAVHGATELDTTEQLNWTELSVSINTIQPWLL